jgi:transcriptional regulator with XRE-family HTH domain
MRYDRAFARILNSTGISQGELARRAGLSGPYVSQLVSGEREPSVTTVRAIGDAVGIPAELIAMLGAEVEDLKGISAENAELLSNEMLALLVAHQEKRAKEKT